MTLYLRDELSVTVRDKGFWQFIQFSDISVEGLSDFFYFYSSDEN